MSQAARASTVCAERGCPVVVPYGYCPAHTRPAWSGHVRVKRITGRRLQRIRKTLLDRQPFCAECQKVGRLPVIRDHIIPLAEGGEDVESNTQALCRECSDRKTSQESLRGRKRAEWR